MAAPQAASWPCAGRRQPPASRQAAPRQLRLERRPAWGAEELHGVGHPRGPRRNLWFRWGGYLDPAAAFAVPADPLVEPQLSDHGHLPALGQPLAAGGCELVERDVDEVGAVDALLGDGEALLGSPPKPVVSVGLECDRLVLLAGVGRGVGGQAADESDLRLS